jgi:dTDP-4-amino-4,6-dideoxygalactose transaminase
MQKMSHEDAVLPSPRLELFKVFVSPTAEGEIGAVLRSGTLTQGPRVDALEAALRTFLGGSSHVATVNSATSGLQLALRVLRRKHSDWPGIVPGDKVLSPALTCWAATCAILNEGLEPVWLDADPKTACVSLEDIRCKLTTQTKVVEVMHWGGTPVDVKALDELLTEEAPRLGFKPIVVEDCAHAFGARYPDGRLVGTSGNICVYSFQAIKVLTCGDGGAIVLPETEHGTALNKACRLLRWFGIDRDRRKDPAADGTDYRLEGTVGEHGGKLHMNDFNATLGLANLAFVEGLVEKARDNTRVLRQGLEGLKHVRPLGSAGDGSSCWLFSLWVSDKPAFLKKCAERDIVASQVHRRNDKHSCVAHCEGAPLPGIDELEVHLACVPCGWWIDSGGILRIIDACQAYEQGVK